MSSRQHRTKQCHHRTGHRRSDRTHALSLRTGADLAELPPLIRRARCRSGKVTYFSIDDAELVLASIDRTDPKRQESRVYRCPLCAGWHLTSQERRSRAAEPTV